MSIWRRTSAISRMAGYSILAATMFSPLALSAQDTGQRGGVEVKPQDNVIELDRFKGTLLRLASPASDVFIANPNIANIQIKSPQLIYIFGKNVGQTTIYAMDDTQNPIYSGTLQVNENIQAQADQSGMLRDYEDKIEKLVPGSDIKLTSFGKMFILEGTVQSPEQADLVVRLCEPLVTGNPLDAMQSFGMTASETIEAARRSSENEAREKSVGIDKTLNLVNRLVILQPTQVNLRVKIAEIGRSTIKELGINWENGFASGNTLLGLATGRDVFTDGLDAVLGTPVRNYLGADGGIGNIFGGFGLGNFDLNYVIDAMDNEGFLSVLAEPNLTALSGETATFLAGGEFPVPVPQRDSITIQFRQFGVQLAFTPTVLSSGRINLHVMPEVSDLSNAGSLQIAGTHIPSITTRKVDTKVELGSGESFAIAGLLENKVVQDATKFPGLGDLPILGALFRSDKFKRNETELLVVVTPYLVKPVDARRIALPTDGYIAPSDMERYIQGQKWQPRVQQSTPGDKTRNAGPTLKGRAGFQLK